METADGVAEGGSAGSGGAVVLEGVSCGWMEGGRRRGKEGEGDGGMRV